MESYWIVYLIGLVFVLVSAPLLWRKNSTIFQQTVGMVLALAGILCFVAMTAMVFI